MRTLLAVMLGAFVLVSLGCGALGGATSDSPGWVKIADEMAGLKATLQKPVAPTPENPRMVPQVVIEKTGSPLDPFTSGSGPLGIAVSVASAAFYFIRKRAIDAENAAAIRRSEEREALTTQLANSVPTAVHNEAVTALANSTPTPTVTTTTVAPTS